MLENNKRFGYRGNTTSSNQKEADTKLLFHTNHVLHENQNQNVVLQSPSGDVDINILCLAMFPLQADRMWVDYGTGDHRHILKLNSIDMNDEKKLALLGFHATNSQEVSEDDLKLLKEFVCHLIGGKGKSVDELRYKKFLFTLNS